MYGLLKLTLAKILPNWVEKAIVLDTDVIFATDISKLWNIFRQEKFVLFYKQFSLASGLDFGQTFLSQIKL